MAENLWGGRFSQGTQANKPTVAEYGAGNFGFYYETDTGILNYGSTGAWSTVATLGANAATTPSTAQSPAGGVSVYGGTAVKTYPLAAPAPNVEKVLICTHASTIAKTVSSSYDIVSTAASTIRSIVFNGLGQCLTLVGLSTTTYGVKSNTGATLS